MPGASPAARGLARAAMGLDADSCTGMLVTELRRSGVLATWTELLQPVLAGVTDRVRSTGTGIEVERLLVECAEAALRSRVPLARQPWPGRPVLLAALEPETARLPLVALAAALAERSIPARLLGPTLPAAALTSAVARIGPSAVCLWAQDGPAPPVPAKALAVRPRPLLLLAGPGSDGALAGTSVRVAPALPDALELLTDVLQTPRSRTGSGGTAR
jgi:hypothetical protein